MKWLLQKIILGIVISSLLLGQSCKKDDITPMSGADSTKAVNTYIYEIVKEWYLWYDKLPSNTPDVYLSPQAFLDSLTYKPIDRWSFVITKKEYDDYFVQGTMYGHGFSFSLDAENRFRIAYLFKNSDLYKAGVHRSWIIEKINGVTPDTGNIFDLLGPSEAGITNIFLFKKPDGSEVTDTFTKKEVTMNMVLYRDTLHVDNKIVGYLVFEGFLADAEAELNEAFDYFNKAGISELVLDLRYNGGGELSIAEYLAGIIGGNAANNMPFVTLTYNDKHQKNNTTTKIIKNSKTVILNRLFVITTKETASASEALINGLKPYMDVYLIGSQTYGKPTGMNVYSIQSYNYILAPVTFKLTNKNNYGDYFDGLPVDKQAIDDIYHDFGNRNEACLSQALYYIQNGTFTASVKAYYVPYKHPKQGWRTEVIAY